ncbi:GLL7 protein, partial [Pitta sordida]|nr:GLL7 protein [Pitta sordida]
MRILYLLLVVLFLVLQGVAGQPILPSPYHPCDDQEERCVPGICRRPYYWVGICHRGFSCCRR